MTVVRRRAGIIAAFGFAMGQTGGGGADNGGDDNDNNKFESWRANATASFSESGFDELTCNATASFQDQVV